MKLMNIISLDREQSQRVPRMSAVEEIEII